MARVEPILKPTETYTESNFLRLHTVPGTAADEASAANAAPGAARRVTIEHLYYRAPPGPSSGWRCETIVDGEAMSAADALFIARSYAAENAIPVIYECHGD